MDFIEDKYRARIMPPNEILVEMPTVKHSEQNETDGFYKAQQDEGFFDEKIASSNENCK